MDILFLLDNLADRCGANVGIILDIASEWHKAGHRLYCLTRSDKFRIISDTRSKIFERIWSFESYEDAVLNEFTASDEWIRASRTDKFLKLLGTPRVLRYYADALFFNSGIIRREYKRQLRAVLAENDFDVILAVTEPYYLAKVVSECPSDADKVIVMMDPYTNNHNMASGKRGVRLKSELKVDDVSDCIFALDFVWKDMDYLPAELKSKTYAFKIPRVTLGQERASWRNKSESPEHVDFVYTGQLYPDIRNPRAMLDMFSRLPENYILHIYGGGTEEVLDEYKTQMGDRLKLHGWVDASEAEDVMNRADILVNLNNSIYNMLPSKLLEYINSGRPILNISYGDKCPSLDYMVKYPNGLTVHVDDDVTGTVERIREFVSEAFGRIVDHNIIEELYSDCIVTNVAGQMLEHIERAHKDGGS